MRSEVTLKINSKQYSENLIPKGDSFGRNLELEDSVEIITEGILYFKPNAVYLVYNESEEMGMSNAKVMMKVKADEIQITRYGKNSTTDMDMKLEPGVAQIVRYKLPMLPAMELEIYTNKYENGLNDKGEGRLMVDYRLTMEESFSRRNILDVEVIPAN